MPLYWNGFQYVDSGTPYTPTIFPQNQNPMQQMQNNIPVQSRTNKIYVSGFEGAKSYQLQPGSEMILCDDNEDIIYDVIVDNTGKRTVTALDIVEHKSAPSIDYSKLATKEDVENLRKEFFKARENEQ